MPWEYSTYTVPLSGTLNLSTLIDYAEQRIDNGLEVASDPTTLRECAPFYSVSTSGTVNLSSFRGRTIQYDRYWDDNGGGGIQN